MALALEKRAKADDILIGDTPKAVRRRNRIKDAQTAGRLWKHSTLADVIGLIGRDQIEHSYVFTLVRNPWDRIVSYYHWLQDQRFDHPAVHLAKATDFSGFLNADHTRRSLHAHPYGRYVSDAQGREYPCHFIRLEHLVADMADLETHLGFKLPLGKANESKRISDWRSYYSTADADLVAKICAADIDRFGYAFD